MISVRKYFRLLPAVVIVGVTLLAIKGVDIARAAQSVTDPDAPDNTGLAPSDKAGGSATPDFAADPDGGGSAAEVDVLSSLTQRRAELDARARALDMRENLLKAGEARVDQKVVALKQLQGDITTLLAKRDAAQDDQIKSLIKTYSTMKPKDAARIFNTLADDVLLPVAKGMKSDILAPVLAAMNPDAAQKLTVKLANLLKLPDSAPAAICPDNGGTAAAVTPGASGPLAALSPPGASPVVMPEATPAVTPAPAPAPTTAAPPPAPAATPPATAPKPVAASAPAPKPTAPKPTTPKPQKVATPAPVKPTTATAPTPVKPQAAITPPPSPIPAVAPPAATTPPVTTPAPAAATTPVTTPAPSTPAPPANAAPTTLGKPGG
jgi:flagellar motility protein MotE (MotC chaperone)